MKEQLALCAVVQKADCETKRVNESAGFIFDPSGAEK